MSKKEKKLLFLENEDQAKNYIKNKDKFVDFIPISLNFKAELLLKSSRLRFFRDEDYESKDIYLGVYNHSKKILDTLFKRNDFSYRGINLLSLFYYDLCVFLCQMQKTEILLKKIIKKESPSLIIVCKSSQHSGIIGESLSYIIGKIYKGKVEFIDYEIVKQQAIRDKRLVKIAGKMMRIYSKWSLLLKNPNRRNIFVFGGKPYFESIVKLLMRNYKNKIVNFDEILKRSFFSRGRLLPFYEFSGAKLSSEVEAKEKIEHFQKLIDKKDFFKMVSNKSLLKDMLKIEIKSIVNGKLLKIMSKIDEMYEIFSKREVKLLLMSEDHSVFAKASIRVAKLLNIPTFVFLHGLPVRDMNFGPFEPDYFLVYGEGIKKKYLEHTPKSKTKIEAIGCPRYDGFIKSKEKNNDNLILYPLDCAGETKIISDRNITKKKQKESLRMIFRALKKFPEYKLLIKLKPNWDMKELPLFVAKEENFNNFEIIERADNLKLMNNAKILIINHTTMGIESLLLEKPVISISFKDLDEYSPYAKINAVKKVYNEKELEKAIKNASNFKQKIPFENFLINDGLASKRATDFVNKIIST